MPPATHAAPEVGTPSGPESSGSWITTSSARPARAMVQAHARPITEPPITAIRRVGALAVIPPRYPDAEPGPRQGEPGYPPRNRRWTSDFAPGAA